MLCGGCQQKEATVHLTMIVAKEIQNVELCEECAKVSGGDDPMLVLTELLQTVKPMPIRI